MEGYDNQKGDHYPLRPFPWKSAVADQLGHQFHFLFSPWTMKQASEIMYSKTYIRNTIK